MKVDVNVELIKIPGNYMVAAVPVTRRGFVTLSFTDGKGDKLVLEVAKGVALAASDEIRRVMHST